MLSVGIVGLPNVGKSTLFQALTRKQVDCENFPFCTIEPNVGVVEVPDPRLAVLAQWSKSAKVIPAAIEFVDIAGLVKGAHKGEGLGNKFLSRIREVDAICHVVRAFEDPNVVHVDGSVDPLRDAEVIEIELAMADMATVARRKERLQGKLKSGRSKELDMEEALLERVSKHLDQGKPARELEYTEDEGAVMRELSLLTYKPMMYVVNVAEEEVANEDWVSPLGSGKIAIPLSVKVEQELLDLDESERQEFMAAIGLQEAGLDRVIRAGFVLLNLITFLTTGEKETRAWPISRGTKGPQAAGTIHTDFEKGYIRAEVIPYEVFAQRGELGAREDGKLRVEGKEYVVEDGDVVHFRVSV
ncbi:redox-regulated ATPase YchF [Candidatus Uhrbacteria bacterium RIFCSPLOWO2_01_FULL_53_9]|uniref:Ribosome-binding ATPase YchF n=3 Tax=Candidatus Uhriibacteriota TaxID=1752732 RepID=A0A1F7UZS2_9BACT|nr:MAG: redox-regulated ATPase YchF [Candidatus Uhrbacteria bacterium RIFCSPHIGHO2_02_FULL_53_13]OGL83247.1 MAG: redox-regulated ATPase YchF [Candidatus Uhrbacteria bacterium RIFCSPLOWO2_01_FULL_53_9]OGL89444.1 MAG: redox-regulated ATPase YchF [Candidatus Uhrbacteria bacterium RIFCSPLOWO2_02_FULL_53_10]